MRILLFMFIIAFSASSAYADEITKDQLISPSAKDILNKIEGNEMESKFSEGELTLHFTGEQTDISANQKSKITSAIITPYQGGRIKVLSYASAPTDSDQSARRISLERAIKIREFLKEKKIPPPHIDLFPMGTQTNKQNTDHALIYRTED